MRQPLWVKTSFCFRSRGSTFSKNYNWPTQNGATSIAFGCITTWRDWIQLDQWESRTGGVLTNERRGAGAPPDNFGRGTWGVLSRSLLCRVLSSWLFLEKNLSTCPYIVHPTTCQIFLIIFICQPLLKITVAPTIFVCKCWSLQLSMGLPLLCPISVKIGPLYRRCSWEVDYTKETEESASSIFAACKTAKQQFWR